MLKELRKDPITRRWVIISKERAKRPHEFEKTVETPINFCPFDYGNESLTPPEVLSFRNEGTKANESGWWVRVVPNKFPALDDKIDFEKKGEGIYDKITGYGYHEVVIETPEHNTNFSKMSVNQLKEILWAYLKRFNEIKKDSSIKYIQIFKNSGKDSGASLSHPHSQIIATPIVPFVIQEELEGASQYFKFKERCVYCDIIDEEIRLKQRVVYKTENFIVLEPYASRFPYETWILPLNHSHDFSSITDEPLLINDLANVLNVFFKRFDEILENPPFNLVLHTSPFIQGTNEYYHWHIEIIPRISNIAGFEWGTGFHINSVLPEFAAKELKKGL